MSESEIYPHVALLLEALAKSALLLLPALALLLVGRRLSAANRHATWTASALALIALFALLMAGPVWRVAVLPSATDASSVAPRSDAVQLTPASSDGSPPEVEPTAFVSHTPAEEHAATTSAPDGGTTAATTPPQPSPARPPTEPLVEPSPAAPATAGASGNSAASVEATPEVAPSFINHAAPALAVLIPYVWLAGTAIVLCLAALSLLRLRIFLSSAVPVENAALLREIEAASGEIGHKGRYCACLHGQARIPFVCGVWRKRLVLPTDFPEWTEERRRMVLLHELAHLLRGDCVAQLSGTLAAALFWFNPLVWLVPRQLRLEREHACDDLVLQSGVCPARYSENLLQVATASSARPPLGVAAVAMARPNKLEGRLMNILDKNRNRRATKPALGYAFGAAALIVALPLAALKLAAVQETDEPARSAELDHEHTSSPEATAAAPARAAATVGETAAAPRQEEIEGLGRLVELEMQRYKEVKARHAQGGANQADVLEAMTKLIERQIAVAQLTANRDRVLQLLETLVSVESDKTKQLEQLYQTGVLPHTEVISQRISLEEAQLRLLRAKRATANAANPLQSAAVAAASTHSSDDLLETALRRQLNSIADSVEDLKDLNAELVTNQRTLRPLHPKMRSLAQEIVAIAEVALADIQALEEFNPRKEIAETTRFYSEQVQRFDANAQKILQHEGAGATDTFGGSGGGDPFAGVGGGESDPFAAGAGEGDLYGGKEQPQDPFDRMMQPAMSADQQAAYNKIVTLLGSLGDDVLDTRVALEYGGIEDNTARKNLIRTEIMIERALNEISRAELPEEKRNKLIRQVESYMRELEKSKHKARAVTEEGRKEAAQRKAAFASEISALEPLEVSIQGDGSIYVKELGPANNVGALRALLRRKPASEHREQVLITATRSTPMKAVVETIDVLKSAGYANVQIRSAGDGETTEATAEHAAHAHGHEAEVPTIATEVHEDSTEAVGEATEAVSEDGH